MTIEELLRDPHRRMCAATPESDALTENDALAEADLVHVAYDLSAGEVRMLLDLRNALKFRMPDAAALVLREVLSLELTAPESRRVGWTTHYVLDSRPSIRGSVFALAVLCLGGLRIRASALSAEFYVGNIPGLPAAPPDFQDNDGQAITEGMPTWDKEFTPLGATFIDRPADAT